MIENKICTCTKLSKKYNETVLHKKPKDIFH